MGYIEDIKKINALAKELISHGMANSFDEAVQKATKMMTEGGDVTRSDDFKASSVSDQQSKAQDKQPQKQSGRDERTGMTWQQAMAKNNEYIVKMLKDFDKQINDFSSEIAKLESNLQELARRQAKLGEMLVTKDSEEINIEVNENNNNKVFQEPKKDAVKEPHPKQGQYSPEDVAVDKMFYFGNK